MKSLAVGLVLGAIAGFAAAVFFPLALPVEEFGALPFPLFAEGPHQQSGSRGIPVLVASGTFIQPDPADPVHYGSGAVRLFQDALELEADFEVGPGPKYHIYLVPEARVTPDTRVEETMFVDLGPLKAFSGRQSYPLPTGLDLRDYGSVVVWCEHFNVLVSPAYLTFQTVTNSR
jgi:hypothetical protein